MNPTNPQRNDVIQWMRSVLRDGEHIDEDTDTISLTGLAEAAAAKFGHADPGGWLDDADHWIWDAATDAAQAFARERETRDPEAAQAEGTRTPVAVAGGAVEIPLPEATPMRSWTYQSVPLAESLFQRAAQAYLAWERETWDPEAAESQFRADMYEFLHSLTPVLEGREPPASGVNETRLERRADGVYSVGRSTWDDFDLARLLAEGWTKIKLAPDQDGSGRVHAEFARPATKAEVASFEEAARAAEAKERAEYERLRAKFEVKPAPMRRNCLSCRYRGARLAALCRRLWGDRFDRPITYSTSAEPFDPTVFTGSIEAEVERWLDANVSPETGGFPPDADGCPGWAAIASKETP